jgi:uncharacterized protein with HEPN domain
MSLNHRRGRASWEKKQKSAAPEIRWIDIRALGHRLRHEYPTIKHRIIWKIVTEELANLRAACERQLKP